MCKLRRTRKVSVCGAADPDTSLYDKSFIYRKTKVDVTEYRIIHSDRRVRKYSSLYGRDQKEAILECGVRNIVEFVLDRGMNSRFNVVTGRCL